MKNEFKNFSNFDFVGRGKILIDGREIEAEIKFIGKLKELDDQNNTITIETIEKFSTFWDITYKI